jgi:hypothetical protein
VDLSPEIIREIFRQYARGQGLRVIVKDLNARRILPPRAGKRGTGSWHAPGRTLQPVDDHGLRP